MDLQNDIPGCLRNIRAVILGSCAVLACLKLLEMILSPFVSPLVLTFLTIAVGTVAAGCASLFYYGRVQKHERAADEQLRKIGASLEKANDELFRHRNEEKKREDQRWIQRKEWEKTFDAIDDWICITDLESTILRSNRAVEKYFDLPVKESIGLKCCMVAHDSQVYVDGCPFPRMLQTKKRESSEILTKNGRWMFITVDPIFGRDGTVISVVHTARDVTERIRTQEEKEKLLSDLKKALEQVKTLRGLIPICSNCKKIRDDQGYWRLLESYIEHHSEARFSHGLCPDCSEKLYGEKDWYIEMKKKREK